jgi:hypothetical protein
MEPITTIINTIKNDLQIQQLLGGPYVYRAYQAAPPRVPSITVEPYEETSEVRSCYNLIKIRDNAALYWVNVWGSKDAGLDFVDQVKARLDKVLLPPGNVPGTNRWKKAGSSYQFEDETQLHHVALRYSCMYSITDA